ncbi:MAG: hypothetical protein K0Q73_2592 [Paenibacillus sp.]|jgi:hypothetical protein|nr:hypothetical protein [Paenibacillus sp.]
MICACSAAAAPSHTLIKSAGYEEVRNERFSVS